MFKILYNVFQVKPPIKEPNTTNKAFKYRLYPNKEQQDLLAQAFGCVRFVYNYFLALRQVVYAATSKNLNYIEQAALLRDMKKTEGYAWLSDVPSQTLQQSLLNLQNAYENFFKKRSGFPKYKKKQKQQSIRFPQNVKVEGDFVYVPKTGWVKVKFHRFIEGKIKSMTVSKTTNGQYFVSFVCEVEKQNPEFMGSEIGIDVGLKTFAVTSEGELFMQPKYLLDAEKQLKRAQRTLARRKQGSRGWKETKARVGKLHRKIANQRQDYQHKLSHSLVEEHGAIFLEDLNVNGMLKNHKLAKHISDSAWGQYNRYLAYKGEWYGCWVEKIDRFAPSSKLCSACGFKNDDLTRKDRDWVCPECGTLHDRDINAAKNILVFGRAGAARKHVDGENVNLAHCE